MTRNAPFGVLLCIPLLTFFSCRMEAGAAASLGEVPDTVSENFRQVSVSPSGRVEVESRVVETFTKKDVSVFTDASVREYDADGNLSLEGRADRIETTGDGDGTADGGIVVRDISGDSLIEAERLEWDDRERLLTGVGTVGIETGDGLAIKGEGFVADMARQSYSFSEGAEGTLILETAAVSGEETPE